MEGTNDVSGSEEEVDDEEETEQVLEEVQDIDESEDEEEDDEEDGTEQASPEISEETDAQAEGEEDNSEVGDEDEEGDEGVEDEEEEEDDDDVSGFLFHVSSNVFMSHVRNIVFCHPSGECFLVFFVSDLYFKLVFYCRRTLGLSIWFSQLLRQKMRKLLVILNQVKMTL